jgi:pimeloyl-ACP methyl ester carboxylesterase/DNA-binding CsgD family transcriptional regulator
MSRQVIRYVTTSDSVRLAWAEAGSGPALVKASNWLSHLEFDWDSPIFSHWMHFFADHFHFIRYDERGCGLTDWDVSNLSFDRWVEDLETVVDASGITEPAILVGISQGAATSIAYAVRHPERVSRMILYGGYSRGVSRRGDSDTEREYRAVIDLVRTGWAKDNPAFRQVFTSRFLPDGTDEQIQWFNELCRKTTSPSVAAPLLEARSQVDVVELLGQVTVPTLVVHARNDNVTPVAEGKRLAAGIPNAEFVEVDSRNHVLLEHEPAWKRFKDAVLDFTGRSPRTDFPTLSAREREVLSLLTEGLSNNEIAARLGISDKTVRNHLSKLFDKLGVWTRAQAIVFARERGFR